ncbi:MAG TPA: phage tail tape measure protein, partial [Terriglobales bacterium]
MAFTVKAIRGLLELEDRWTTKLQEAATKTAGFAGKMEKQLEDTGRKMTAGGATLSAAITAPIVGFAAVGIKSANDFEAVMNQVEAMVSDSQIPGSMEKMRAAAQKWGQETVFSSKEAAEAMVELGKAGFDSDKAIAALPSTLQLAIAGQMGLAEAATLSANTMATFRLDADGMAKANDILAKAAAESTIDVRDLAETFKYVGPLAAAAKVELSELTAASALLGTAGIKGSQAGTTLRGAIVALMSPTKKQKEALEQMGVAHEFVNGKLNNMTSIIDKIQKSGADASVIMQAFGKYSGPGMVQLVSLGSTALGEMNDKLAASDGYAQKVADTFMKGLPGAMEQMKGSVETAGIALGTVLLPAAIAVANGIRKVADFATEYIIPAFTAMPKPVQVAVGVLLALAAAIGPLLAGFGLIATGVSTLIPLLPALGTVIAALTGPIGITVLAISALTAAWFTWGDDVKAAVGTAVDWVVDKWNTWSTKTTELFTGMFNSAKQWLVDAWEGSIFQSVARLIESMIKLWVALHVKALEIFVGIGKAAYEWLVEKLKPVVEFLQPVFDTIAKGWAIATEAIRSVFTKFVDAIKGEIDRKVALWQAAYTLVESIVSKMYTAVKTWLVDKFTAIVQGVKEKIDAVTGFFNDMYDKVVGHSYVPDMVNEVGDWFGKLDGRMVKPAQAATDLAAKAFYKMGNDIAAALGASKGTAGEIGSLLSGAFGSFKGGGISGLAGFAKAQATDFATGFLKETLSFIPGIGPIVSQFAGPIVNGVKKLFGGMFQGNDTRKMFQAQFGDLDAFHTKLLSLGDAGEQFWIRMTQKVGKGDKAAATALINEITEAFANQTTAADAATAATEKQTAAQTEFAVKMNDRMKALNDEYQKLTDSVKAEAPEEVMGVIEAQSRARLDQIEAEKFAIQAQMDAVAAAAETAQTDIAAQTEELHDKIRTTFERNPVKIPYYYEAQNDIPTTGGTVVPSGATSVAAGGGGRQPVN